MPTERAPLDTAMVFAAGLGTRMRPITNRIPKPLVQIGGKAMLDHMLDRLADGGVTRAIVNVHHLPDQIEAHLKGRTRPEIIISDEREKLLDQGGGIKKVLPLIGDADFFICNTDAVWLEGPHSAIAAMREAWRPQDMDILLLVAATSGSVGVDWPGDFHMAPDGRLRASSTGQPGTSARGAFSRTPTAEFFARGLFSSTRRRPAACTASG